MSVFEEVGSCEGIARGLHSSFLYYGSFGISVGHIWARSLGLRFGVLGVHIYTREAVLSERRPSTLWKAFSLCYTTDYDG
jgi:hypothetical protein